MKNQINLGIGRMLVTLSCYLSVVLAALLVVALSAILEMPIDTIAQREKVWLAHANSQPPKNLETA